MSEYAEISEVRHNLLKVKLLMKLLRNWIEFVPVWMDQTRTSDVPSDSRLHRQKHFSRSPSFGRRRHIGGQMLPPEGEEATENSSLELVVTARTRAALRLARKNNSQK